MRIAIIGAGNIGTALAADLSRHHIVSVYSSKPQLFSKQIRYYDPITNESFESTVSLISDSYERVLDGAEIIFIALPTPFISKAISTIQSIVCSNTSIGFVPGAGGVEFLSSSLIHKGCCVFGFERVPYIARIIQYGHFVKASKKDRFRIAVFPRNKKEGLDELMARLFNRPCVEMSGFLSMTLTPTLHVARLYDLYSGYRMGMRLQSNPFFYSEWRDFASRLCFQLDDELHCVTRRLRDNGLDASDLVPYKLHYASTTVEALTQKIRSIPSLSKIKGPVIENDDGTFTLDVESRYFTESFPFRLAIVKGIAELMSEDVPLTTRVMEWYQQLARKNYFIDGLFKGKDAYECGIPQNFGIDTLDKLVEYYSI